MPFADFAFIVHPESWSSAAAVISALRGPRARGARICFRNLMIRREVPEDLRAKIQLREDLSRSLTARDRSFAYSRVQAYVVAR
jgi:hypothetical protein